VSSVGNREAPEPGENVRGETGCGCGSGDDKEVLDVVIIGGGPAGIACAIQLQRMGAAPLLIEKSRLGGLLRYANFVENYPGFPAGISGVKLAERMDAQLRASGVTHIKADVGQVWKNGENFLLRADESEILCKKLIVASGSRPTRVEFEVLGNPLITYDLFDLLDGDATEIAIIGGGDVAFDHAVRLAECGKKVTILSRGEPRANCPLLNATRKLGIRVITGAGIKSISGNGRGAVVVHERGKTDADAVLVACGREPRLLKFQDGLIATDDNGRSAAAVSGLYIIGDARGAWRHAGIAVGDGLSCAMDIFKELRRERDAHAVCEEVNEL